MDPRDPRVSPLYADLKGLPPTLIQVGSAETLLDDATRLGKAGRRRRRHARSLATYYPRLASVERPSRAWPPGAGRPGRSCGAGGEPACRRPDAASTP